MKENLKGKQLLSLLTIGKRLYSVPRHGVKQQAFGVLVFPVLAILLTICVLWGPSSSSRQNAVVSDRLQHQKKVESLPSVPLYSKDNETNEVDTKLGVILDETEAEKVHHREAEAKSSTSLKDKNTPSNFYNDDVLAVNKTLEEKLVESEYEEASPDLKEERTLSNLGDEDGQAIIMGDELAKLEQAENKLEVGEESPEPTEETPQSASEAGKDNHQRTTDFRFSPAYKNWDDQRDLFLKDNILRFRAQSGSSSRVMLVSGDFGAPCSKTCSFFKILGTKNKADYASLHDLQFYFGVASSHPQFLGEWSKLPLLRTLMVNHPEIDWFLWVDNDAWIIDMAFEIPFDAYTAGKKNLFIQRTDSPQKIWTSTFGIRNCQWSLDFLENWASLKTNGEFRRQATRAEGLEADHASALAYLLNHETNKWTQNVEFESDFSLIGDWNSFTPRFEKLLSRQTKPTQADRQWPLSVEFSSCQESPNHTPDECFGQLLRTFDFADNQVLRSIGFRRQGKLGDGNAAAVPIAFAQPERVEGQLYHIHPNVTNWDEQRVTHRKVSKEGSSSKTSVLLISGSGMRECRDTRGTSFLFKALKNKIDYARMHDFEFYYNMASLDGELTGWWVKSVVIRTMMLAHPGVEWIWWVDSDAVFTDMEFEPPFERYEARNLILWGDEEAVYKRKSFVGINAGIMIFRNCQWSLDFLDSIIPMGASGLPRKEYGRMLGNFLSQRPTDMESEDQSCIVYTLVTQREKFGSKTWFENSYTLSGSWRALTKEFERMMAEHHPGLGDSRWPLITHFAGCQPCSSPDFCNFDVDTCFREMNRALHFADNQVVRRYGLQHDTLSDQDLRMVYPTDAAV